MKVIPLQQHNAVYSGNSYLVLGSWNRIEDVNTLVDVGTDGSISREIDSISTGFGKRAVEQVVLTHSHFDHGGGLPVIRRSYQPIVIGHPLVEEADHHVHDCEIVRMGDRDFEVIFAPGHSADSICLYCEQERVLFSGDTPLRILTVGGSYSYEFVELLQRLARRQVEVIYPGHGGVIRGHVRDMLLQTLKNVKKSTIMDTLGIRVCGNVRKGD